MTADLDKSGESSPLEKIAATETSWLATIAIGQLPTALYRVAKRTYSERRVTSFRKEYNPETEKLEEVPTSYTTEKHRLLTFTFGTLDALTTIMQVLGPWVAYDIGETSVLTAGVALSGYVSRGVAHGLLTLVKEYEDAEEEKREMKAQDLYLENIASDANKLPTLEEKALQGPRDIQTE